MLPRHIHDIPEPKNNKPEARAPYNFVELPNKIVEVKSESLPQYNSYYSQSENRYTGRIECKLITKSPLYIRSGLTREEFECGAETKDLPDFFYTQPEARNEKPVIPGSSLRGMTRSLIEIISFSKLTKVTNKKPFYRSLGDKALQEIYASNFIEQSEEIHPNNPGNQIPCYRSKVRAGFIRKINNNDYVIEECGYGRIDRNDIPYIPNQPRQPLYLGKKPGSNPNWKYQHQHIYVDIDAEEQNYFFPRQVTTDRKTGTQKERHPDIYLRYRRVNSASLQASSNIKLATLLITGDIQYKHLEFVFLHDKIKEYQVADEVIQRFHDDDQITKWQEDSYPKDKPTKNSRPKNGYIQNREPVFFLLKEDGETIRFLGRAQMFRLPYDLSPYDLVPDNLRNSSVTDITEAIFGYVDGKERENSRAGRVFFNDAICTQPGNVWYQGDFEKTLIPKILSSPKPTTFQHYLVQTSTDRKQLKHYSPQPNDEKTVIRGHKLYWHQGSNPDVKLPPNPNEASDTQTTQIKPIKSCVHFTFTINFENLSDVELGALLWVLSISSSKAQAFGIGKQGEDYCLSLGMGKPLGMGAVKIKHKLCLSDRTTRYEKLFDGNHWNEAETSASDEQQNDFIKAFEKYVIDNISNDDKPKEEEVNSLKNLPRIEMLLAMLRWDSPLTAENTRYMTIKPTNEYTERPVLPTPLQVMNIPDNHNTLPEISKNREQPGKPKGKSQNNSDSRNPAIARPQKPKK